MRAPTGIQIRRKRLETGLSQAALARAVGISATYLNLIENNKRAIGGKLLVRIGERLGLDLDQLSGVSEARSIQVIEELLGDPAMHGIVFEQAAIRDLVARFPEAGIAMTRLYRLYQDASANIESYINRLRSDPLLSQMLHQVLNRISAIRSVAEILEHEPDIPQADERRFVVTISRESEGLTDALKSLVEYFDRTASTQRPVSPLADLDEAIIAHRNHFPELENVADELRKLFPDELSARTLAHALEADFGISCEELEPGTQTAQRYFFDKASNRLLFRTSVSNSTRLFQMVQLYAQMAARDAILETVDTLRLHSPEANALAERAMAAYVAGAMMMPYERYLQDAELLRYDIDALGRRYGTSFEQAAHRLVTMRRKGAEAVPFGFLRADRAGRLSKRYPLPGLSLPVSGYGCLLWPIYRTNGDNTFVRQVAEFPGGERFLLIARTVAKNSHSFRDDAPTYSVMLACDLMHADRTVYADAIDLRHRGVPVGPSCLLCSRQDCGHRQERNA